MEYLIKASAIIALFYILYKILLQRETFFELNRWFLLIGLVAAFLLPFIVIPIYVEAPPLDFSGYIFETPIAPENTEKPFNLLDYVPLIYGLGVVFFSIRFIVQFTSLALVFIKNKGEKIDGYRFIKTTNNVSPFSFFNWIVYNPIPFSKTELEQIITHEKVHAKQSHSFDILITHISCVVLWFNPFIWLYNKDLKQNLEFIADAVTATKTDCKKSYQYTLLKTSMPSHQMALSNPFYNSLIKKRIVMLHKSKSKKINQLKHALVIPALALFLMSFNTEEVYINQQSPSTETLERKNVVEVIISKDFTNADLENLRTKLKQEGYTAKFKDIKRNSNNEITAIKIEVSSKSSNANYNIDGDEPINFIKISIDNNNISIGNSNNILKEKHMILASDDEDEHKVAPSDPKKKAVIISSDNNNNNNNNNNDDGGGGDDDDDDDNNNDNTTVKEEVIIKSGDGIQYNKNPGSQLKPWKVTIGSSAVSSDTINWKPAKKRVGLNWVSDEDKKISIQSENESEVKNLTTSDKQPLFIVDGKEISKKDMNALDPNHNEKIDVLKGENATRLYGDKGKDGVILITTKKDKREDHLIVKKPFDSISKRKNLSKHTITFSGEPLYIIDGKEEKEEAFEKLNPDKITSVDVLKGDYAIKKYGKKGKHGVFEITTKKK